MDIFNVQRVDSHGGSLRVFVKKTGGKHEINEEVIIKRASGGLAYALGE